MIRVWHLGDDSQSLVLAAFKDGLPEAVYFGPRLPETEDLTAIAEASRMDVTGGMLDANPPLSFSPEASRTFPGQAGLTARDGSGAVLAPRFRFQSNRKSEADLRLTYADEALGLALRFIISCDLASGLFKLETELASASDITVDWLAAPVLPVPAAMSEMIEFSGRWCSEFQATRLPFAPGARVRDNRTGRTDHAHFPGLIAVTPATANTCGEAVFFHYGWSGGHRMIAEELADGRRQVQFGHASASYPKGTAFRTAPLYVTYSASGLNGGAVRFQKHLRNRVSAAARKPRPVHYNCWEAVYFDHKLDELKDIAARAADLGAERFVLDDGWFGRRDGDTSSLGDWVVDARKYPDGLDPLISHVTSLGMEFGLWFEPEMVNEDSDLFRTHPDWVLGPMDQTRGRQQLVLDMANANVRDYLFNRMSALLSAYDISYIKWDHNRVLPVVDARQTGGVYALIDRLHSAFPVVEIESCSSGGGRIDLGILERTQRVWLSDSNDALERQRIQHDAALFLPACVTGSHVGPRHCHTSGRKLPISLRAWTAAQRHMGFEMDPRELTGEEAETLKSVTSWWKDNRGWLMEADILRLDSPDPAVSAEIHVARDGARFAAFSALGRTSVQSLPRPLALTGLDPDATYHVNLHNKDDIPSLSRGSPLIKNHQITASGQYLMAHGLNLPWRFPETVWVLEGQRL